MGRSNASTKQLSLDFGTTWRYTEKMGGIGAPFYICIQRARSQGSKTPALQPHPHSEAARTVYYMLTNSGRLIRFQVSLVLKFVTSAQIIAGKKHRECRPLAIKITYKANHGKRVRFEPTFAPEDSAFIERTSLLTSPAECLPGERYTKLLTRRLGQCRIISVRPE